MDVAPLFKNAHFLGQGQTSVAAPGSDCLAKKIMSRVPANSHLIAYQAKFDLPPFWAGIAETLCVTTSQ